MDTVRENWLEPVGAIALNSELYRLHRVVKHSRPSFCSAIVINCIVPRSTSITMSRPAPPCDGLICT